jgi:hypothetical protein
MNNKPIVLTGSYLQTDKHAIVSDKFNVVQAASVGDAMQRNGLQLVSLSTGKARHEDKANFQRTLSRYRGPKIGDENGLPIHLDVIYDSKHMGRGVDKILLGVYRMVCTNGLFVGSNFFAHAIRHSGQTYDSLNEGIAAALDSAARLTELINRMRGVVLTPDETQAFALEAVKLLTPENAVQVMHRLLKRQREADNANDLWSVYNVVQENAMRGHSIGYTLAGTDAQGKPTVRAMNVRAIKPNTGKDADFNQGLFDIAAKLVA